ATSIGEAVTQAQEIKGITSSSIIEIRHAEL
ncbi:unnamed protein product, partial [marine sediment metagenome]